MENNIIVVALGRNAFSDSFPKQQERVKLAAKAIADLISTRPGGKGCARECIKKVMELHGEWHLDVSDYKKKF